MKIGSKCTVDFRCNNQIIEIVNSYKYLGHVLNSHRTLHNKMPEYLVNQAQKALFALQSRIKPSLGYIPPSLAIKMFDSYILPILEYNSMLWCMGKQHNDMEKVQIRYLKSLLGVRKQTPTLAVYAETGRFPLMVRQKINMIKYWGRLMSLPSYDILNKCLKIQESLYIKGQTNWYNKTIHIINECNINSWETKEPGTLVSEIKLKLYESEQSRILSEINDSEKHPKLRTYKLFKTTYCFEPYLNLNLPKKTYNNIARFRLSSHNLRIETGRHETPKIPLEERKCNKCDSNEVEDELHCLLICNNYAEPRNQLILKANKLIPNFHNFDKIHQFKALMSNKEPEMIYALGNFLNKVM